MDSSIIIAVMGALAAILGAPLFTYLVSKAKNQTDLTLDERKALREERLRIDEERNKELRQLRADNANLRDSYRDLEDRYEETDKQLQTCMIEISTLKQQDEQRTRRIELLETEIEKLRRDNLRLYQELHQRGL